MHTRTRFSLLLGASLLAGVPAASAQQAVPIRELSAVEAKSTNTFGTILGLRALAGGNVLVNDGFRRQLTVLDDKLANPNIVVDSVAVGGQSYGPRPSPLIPYLADSSLFVDGASLSLLVIDPAGKIAHVMSAPKSGDLRFLAGGSSGVDSKGNLVYRGSFTMNLQRAVGAPTPGAAPVIPPMPDSAPILRANFETRTVDTIGKVKIAAGTRTMMSQDANGKMVAKMTINPVVTLDEWAVLSDGTVALVRGHDYHVDWIRPDGSKFSSAKLPFDWKRLTDDDKQRLIDSARTAFETAQAAAKTNAGTPGAAGGAAMEVEQRAVAAMHGGGAGAGGGGGGMTIVMRAEGGGGAGGAGGAMPMVMGGPGGMAMPTPVLEFVPLREIADYYPAIRQGAAKADLEGNLWILPTTSAQSKAGELVYDVVNNRGELFQRVRIPLGRSIAGFGHKGVVYLMYRDGTNGWLLEKTRILNNTRATDF